MRPKHLTVVLTAVLMATTIFSAQAQLGKLRDRLGNTGKTEALLDAAGDAVTALRMSDAEIAQLGAEAAAAYDELNEVLPDNHEYSVRLAKIVQGLGNNDGLNLNFKVYWVEDVNAFALPDGSVRVFAGLMDLMSDDELRFVIGHEIGHVKHGHSKEGFRTAYLAQAARKGLSASDSVVGALAESELGGLVEAIIKARHSQSNELEADRYGLDLLRHAEHDPAAAVSALRRLDDGKRRSSLLSSHPDAGKRAELIAKAIK